MKNIPLPKNAKIVPDRNIVTVWICPECKEEEEVAVDFFQDNGTPMCCNCDEDLDYLFTYVLL